MKIYDLQVEQMRAIEKAFFIELNSLSDKDAEHLVNEKILRYIQLLQVELSEVVNELNYKPHKPAKDIDWDKVKMELIDSLKYTLCLFILANVGADELEGLFREKTQIVYEAFKTYNGR